MPLPLADQRILLGVTGGIAAYKSADLVRRLREAGAQVRVVMTAGAAHFITATTLQAVSGHPVRDSLWDAAAEAAMGHIELARWATAVVIAPASADTLARLAQGHADDLLSTLCLATTAPLLLAPAMNHRMWAHPATQANLATLVERGARVIGPDSGDQACGETGPGRMSEPTAIVAALAPGGSDTATAGRLSGKRVLVTAGPTFEDIDPVRFIGNRSSGKMGFALAAAARRHGAEVTLVAGPVALPTPVGVQRIDVRSAQQMHDAVMAAIDAQDLFIAAAAVADYAPVHTSSHKLKKSEASRSVELVRTRDILADVAARESRPFLLGFAAETDEVAAYARGKLQAKGLDLIAANRVGVAGSGFEADENSIELIWADGERRFGPAPKTRLAQELLDEVVEHMEKRSR
ncbi:bifunctional phosphopantothenoylcysteine decarboxylase/phosphopantothenate--cysteine ligase CoaBC [Alkalisalibacterium limincola]|uniref:Coenzyme A biosynthesis bifunctional protein CoaBC n=1 Tax=Alkalisalibacterium limincola TaxID=2699169 RepID=A0A5C8KL47_9GAMM|nr:bifunctional phosphopantothenoylcysteine decarboxylase/phosphopantothenate--cysteine ligase CoaBC [Alkalisalibacterium limincola]TXK60793.1 bifunctional phosphopantothenoylcysteine decarboxylase/phosphopantothenate--cysteine ligase CoaBC [Alkalisalibacterium limincola]